MRPDSAQYEQVSQVSAAQQWEYRTELVNVAKVFSGKLKTDAINAALASAGADAWELVSMFQGQNVKATLPGVLMVFKRPVYRGY